MDQIIVVDDGSTVTPPRLRSSLMPLQFVTMETEAKKRNPDILVV